MRHQMRPHLPLVAILALGTGPALAQGTPQQRQFCAPDAVRLCPDTIPDVGRTKACMMRHVAELSSQCRAVFAGGTPAASPARKARIARAAPEAAPETKRPARESAGLAAPAPRPRRARRPAPGDDFAIGSDIGTGADIGTDADIETSARPDPRDVAKARRVFTRLCAARTLDPSSCQLANFALQLAR